MPDASRSRGIRGMRPLMEFTYPARREKLCLLITLMYDERVRLTLRRYRQIKNRKNFLA